MKTYCEAVESLKIKALFNALQSLSDSQKYGDGTLSDALNRFVGNGINMIKQDQDTQEEVITYLVNDPEDCNNPYF